MIWATGLKKRGTNRKTVDLHLFWILFKTMVKRKKHKAWRCFLKCETAIK